MLATQRAFFFLTINILCIIRNIYTELIVWDYMKTTDETSTTTFSLFKLLSLLLLPALILGSCQKPANEEPELLSAANVVNATIGMPQLGFFINRSGVQGDPLKYTDESGYFITFPGARDFDVLADGVVDYILKTNFTFKQNTYHSIFIVGESASISALFTEDDLSNPPAGKAKIRFVNLSPDAGGLVVTLKNGTALFPEQAFKTVSQFITMDPGVYDLQAKTPTGTVLVEKNVTIASGRIYTAWAKGLRAGTSNSPLGLQFRSVN